MKLVFDTSVLIDALRLKKDARGIFAEVENKDYKLYLPSIVGFEIYSGESSKRPEQVKRIKEFLNYFEIVELDWNIAQKAGEIYRDYVSDLEVPDYIVAATAQEIGASVVTVNKKHFQKIPGILLYYSNLKATQELRR